MAYGACDACGCAHEECECSERVDDSVSDEESEIYLALLWSRLILSRMKEEAPL